MMDDLPARRREYIGPVTDTRIWDGFETRPGDVILSTPPKCGTTWSQAIIMMLIHGKADTGRMVWNDSMWLDCGLADQTERARRFGTQTHRRCIKSHSPFDSLPYDPDLVYITVYRHPIDVHFSMERHVGNMKFDILDFLFPPEPRAPFARFLETDANDCGTDDLTLAAILHHYQSFRRFAHLPNMHFFHYTDLTQQFEAQIRGFGAAMSISPSTELVKGIAEAASFDSMKEATKRFASEDGKSAFKVEHEFFDSATSGKWRGRLGDSEMEAYHRRFSELATKEEIRWLEGGSLGAISQNGS
jgi:hypothetical protein